ncbi:MAG: hypothetical protein U1E52_00740 [Geminicoccaceae bacterium]
MRTPLSTATAPEAATTALALGQPHCGATSRSSVRPKLSIARAVVPMFSPIWVRHRTTTGADPAEAVMRRALSPRR